MHLSWATGSGASVSPLTWRKPCPARANPDGCDLPSPGRRVVTATGCGNNAASAATDVRAVPRLPPGYQRHCTARGPAVTAYRLPGAERQGNAVGARDLEAILITDNAVGRADGLGTVLYASSDTW